MMGEKVGIDCRSLQAGSGGSATYVRNLLQHIPFLDCIKSPTPRNNFLWNQLRVPPAQLSRGWTAYHAPSYTAPLINFCPLVLTVQDISYLVNPDWYPYQMDGFRRFYYVASLRRANRIIVPSDFSRSELLRLYPWMANKVRRVYLGVSEFFQRDEDLAERVRVELQLPETFILHVGDIHARRNIAAAARAAEKLQVPLVLVGSILKGGEPFATWRYLYSHLTDEQLKGIYSAAKALVYPSLYEGFGLPVLEAMACGLPVVASNRSCLPEICGTAAALVDHSVESIIEGIKTVLKNRQEYIVRGFARAKEFPWQKTAEETVKVYNEVRGVISPEGAKESGVTSPEGAKESSLGRKPQENKER